MEPHGYASIASGEYVLQLSGAINAATLLPSGAMGVTFQSKGPLSSLSVVRLVFCRDVRSILSVHYICGNERLHSLRG